MRPFPFSVLIWLLTNVNLYAQHNLPKPAFDLLPWQDERLLTYDVNYYKLEIEANNTNTEIKGCVTIKATVAGATLDTFVIDMAGHLMASSVTINGKNVQFSQNALTLKAAVPEKLKDNDKLEVTICYAGEVPSGNTNPGLHLVRSNGVSVLWTLSEPFFGYRWWPCKMVLDDKADSVEISILTDAANKAGSNGVLTETIKKLPGNKTRYIWKSFYPTTYYLVSFAIAPYVEYTFTADLGQGQSVDVINYVYNQRYLTDNKDNINKTSKLLALYSELFGIYPFYREKYGHCSAPGTSMENQTMTSISSFDFWLVAHEMAHQWFGNYVTCSNWQDIWINEGFASYAEYLAIERLQNKSDAMRWLDDTYSSASQDADKSIFVPASQITSYYRVFHWAITYRKGAAIIHMLRTEMANDSLFFTTLRTFLNQYAFKTAGTHEFIAVLEEVTEKDWDWFFEQWYYGKGYPELEIVYGQVGDSIRMSIKQSNPGVTPEFFNAHLDLAIKTDQGEFPANVLLNGVNSFAIIPIKGKLIDIAFDPEKKLLHKIRRSSCYNCPASD